MVWRRKCCSYGSIDIPGNASKTWCCICHSTVLQYWTTSQWELISALSSFIPLGFLFEHETIILSIHKRITVHQFVLKLLTHISVSDRSISSLWWKDGTFLGSSVVVPISYFFSDIYFEDSFYILILKTFWPTSSWCSKTRLLSLKSPAHLDASSIYSRLFFLHLMAALSQFSHAGCPPPSPSLFWARWHAFAP